MKLTSLGLCCVLALALPFPLNFLSAQAAVWDSNNDPARFDVDQHYVYRLADLPHQATLAPLPWSETYWPAYKGSINVRWNTPNQDGFKYTPPSYASVKQMSLEELSHLAPSEKYDLYRGNYYYPLWNEVKSHADPAANRWVGACDGWSIASIQYPEPNSVTLANPDGILIPFGSSDIKALMTYAAEFHFTPITIQVGRKCITAAPLTPSEIADCEDINAGAMHLIMANQLGIQKVPLITERDEGVPIWQQPTYGYDYELLGSALTSVVGAHGVRIHATLYYTDDLDQSYWEPSLGSRRFHANHLSMDYVLDLDASEKIVGGSWLKGSDHPDFFWELTNHLTFTGIMSGVRTLVTAAQANENCEGRFDTLEELRVSRFEAAALAPNRESCQKVVQDFTRQRVLPPQHCSTPQALLSHWADTYFNDTHRPLPADPTQAFQAIQDSIRQLLVEKCEKRPAAY